MALKLSPYITVRDAAAAISFYTSILGAKEIYRLADQGIIGHAELLFGDSLMSLSDEFPAHDVRSPFSVGGTPVKLHLYVDDVDAVMQRAEQAGAKILRPAKDEFYGDRAGMIEDPFGHHWHIATQQEQLSPEEIQKRFAQLQG